MNQSKIAVRYAKALFELATEKGLMEEIYNDVVLVFHASKTYEQFGAYLKSPVVKPSQKVNFITQVFKGNVSETMLSFLRLLVENRRESSIDDIARRYIHVYRVYKGIKTATITTASALDDATRTKLNEMLSQVYKTGIELELHNDESIIGGFILKIEDNQYDASVVTGLKRMKTALLG
jgi:F-type H+-transporting ATPase subunit delta